MVVASASSQGRLGLVTETQWSRPYENVQSSTQQGFVNQVILITCQILGSEEYDANEYLVDIRIQCMENQNDASSYNKYICELHLSLIIDSKAALKDMFPGCFSAVGKFKDFKYHTSKGENPKSVLHKTCKIALSLTREKWDEMVRQDIIVQRSLKLGQLHSFFSETRMFHTLHQRHLGFVKMNI